ncbi:MAG: sel1 repeat family protein, partial [Pseudomonadota bacterium]|nr:sel1 repeat family protein [Pseudomonadota bacterium]
MKEDLIDDPRAIAAGFLNFHPDLQYRSYGIDAHAKKNVDRAMVLFRGAAFYGDKPSQAMIGEMTSRGEGVPRDQALAYVWMDLAAERGYVDFTLLRERYWRAL